MLPSKIIHWKFIDNKLKKEEELKIDVTIEEGPQNPKGEILMIHGWPDSADMWKHQIEAFKDEYRCIAVTLPNFGKEKNFDSWGIDHRKINKMLAEVVEKHSKTKKVTILMHDFGSVWGYDL